MSIPPFHKTLFQSTLPREERRHRCRQQLQRQNFNPRSHERSDYLKALDHYIKEISIHAPTRGATLQLLPFPRFQRISIHAPTRGATPVVGCPPSADIISIHAPTRGATPSFCGSPFHQFISIHAPTRGATLCSPSIERP